MMLYLHPNNSVDEEDENDEKCNPGQSLEWLDEGPEQSSYTLSFRQELD